MRKVTIVWVSLMVSMGQVCRGAEDGMPWSDAVGGLKCRVEVNGELGAKAVYAPGEKVQVRVMVSGERGMHVPSEVNSGQAEIHVETSGGKEYIADPLLMYTNGRGLYKVVGEWRLAEGGSRWMVADATWRLSGSEGYWVAAKTGKDVMFSMRAAGTYKVWAEYEVKAGKGSPKDAWRGRMVTPVTTWTVAERPTEKRRMTLTAEQEAMLAKWLGGDGGMVEKLRPEMLEAENEGLALKMVEIGKENGKESADALGLLEERSGDIGTSIGIDGPYLKMLAMWEVECLEAKGKGERKDFSGDGASLVYVTLHPEDEAFCGRLAAIAKACCRLKAESVRAMSLFDAWRALIAVKVLRDGITVEEAKGILGEPNAISAEEGVGWRVESPRHVNPYVGATLKEGKLWGWRVGN